MLLKFNKRPFRTIENYFLSLCSLYKKNVKFLPEALGLLLVELQVAVLIQSLARFESLEAVAVEKIQVFEEKKEDKAGVEKESSFLLDDVVSQKNLAVENIPEAHTRPSCEEEREEFSRKVLWDPLAKEGLS